MKKHFGYLESTAFKRSPRQCAIQKKNFPTKNTPIATFLGFACGRLNGWQAPAVCVEGANLPVFVVRAVSGLSGVVLRVLS